MKLRLITCLSVLLLSLFAGATDYTVKKAGGNFTTIQACATAAVAGDTCTVFTGTYVEHVSVRGSGTASNPIKFQVNPGDTVLMQGFELNGNSYITIGGSTVSAGFVMQAPASSFIRLVQMQNASHIVIQNNTIGGTAFGNNGGQAGSHCIRTAGGGTAPSSFVTIQNNLIQWCGIDTSGGAPYALGKGVRAEGDHWLIQNNTMPHLSDGVSPVGPYMVIRNNTFGPWTCSDIGLTDGPKGNACDSFGGYHVDVIDHACSASTIPPPNLLFNFSLIENNVLAQNSGPNGHFALMQAYICGEHNSIIRFNAMNNVGSYFVIDGGIAGNFSNIKTYNNTIANFFLPPCEDTQLYGTGVLNTAAINNIHYNSSNMSTSCPFGAKVYGLDNNSLPTFTGRNDLAFTPGCTSNCFTGVIATLPGVILTRDPLFVNPSVDAFDFHLKPGSPAIGTGGRLTNVAATDSGTGTTLRVDDAAYFSDGAGGSGTPIVEGDWIRVGNTATAYITAIDYSTNVITLAQSITRLPGDPVFLFKDSSGRTVLFGNLPDIGAYPFGLKELVPPSGLTVVVQ